MRLEVGRESSPRIVITFCLNTQHRANHYERGRVPVPECIREDKNLYKANRQQHKAICVQIKYYAVFILIRWNTVEFRERPSHRALGTKGN